MRRDLGRLLRPRHIAVIGGGAWCDQVVRQSLKTGFSGDIWPVHPKASKISGVAAVRTLADLPDAPDACFIGVNRTTTVEIVRELATIGAGGAVCFASGFKEAENEDAGAAMLQQELLDAAGGMPILGPNCYGFINYLDGALLWPDQHGGGRVDTGVALITQSSNIAINLTMHRRALPLAYVVTAGNQAQTGIAEIGMALLEDARVSALGLHIEGFGDIRAFEALAARARTLGKPIVALKVGKSLEARAATVSHSASLAGGDAGASALLARLNISRVDTLPELLEALKLLHVCGPLASNRVASISCSGGEASLVADTALGRGLSFPALNEGQKTALRAALGPMVALANPLDYHTYIWRDTTAMTRAWAAMMDRSIALTFVIVDFPHSERADASDWECAIDAAIAAKAMTGANVAMVATLPELMPENVAGRLMAGGVVPLCGLPEALAAASVAHGCNMERGIGAPRPVLLPPQNHTGDVVLVPEARAKELLAAFGVPVPRSGVAQTHPGAAKIAARLGFPLVVKGMGLAHKSEHGAVVVGILSHEALADALNSLPDGPILIEEMIGDPVAELLVGVVRDPAHGFVLTLAAGGVLSEILKDRVSLLLPVSAPEVTTALGALRIAPVLAGYRGGAAADRQAIVDTVLAVQDYVITHAKDLHEVEINPLICRADGAVAADALIRHEET